MKDVFTGVLLHMESDCNWRDNDPNLSDALMVTATVLSCRKHITEDLDSV